LERRLYFLAKNRIRHNRFAAADRAKKSKETCAVGDLAKVKDLLVNLARLNPHELHTQEVKRYQITREGVNVPGSVAGTG
jgi:hypothetical protein